MRVLLVEDDDRIAQPLAEDLRHQNYVVDVASDGIEGWDYTQTVDYNLILLDLMLPRLDGISLCKRLRTVHYPGFILMLTAKDTTTDKIIGLDAGADDYLVKPFELEELEARMRALLRRPPELRSLVLKRGDIEIEPATRIVTYAQKPLNLTPKEYLILEYLMQNPSQVFTRSMLLNKLWEIDRTSGDNTVKTHITNLRRKLKKAGCKATVIDTVYGVGYRLCLNHTDSKPD